MFEISSRTSRKTYLLNAVASKGEMEGRPYDSTKLTVLTSRKNSDGSSGLDTEILVWGTSDNKKKIAHLNFSQIGPVLVELEVEDQLRGKGEKEKRTQIVHDLRILQPEFGGAPAPASKKAA